jgi:hypothetical protein
MFDLLERGVQGLISNRPDVARRVAARFAARRAQGTRRS